MAAAYAVLNTEDIEKAEEMAEINTAVTVAIDSMGKVVDGLMKQIDVNSKTVSYKDNGSLAPPIEFRARQSRETIISDLVGRSMAIITGLRDIESNEKGNIINQADNAILKRDKPFKMHIAKAIAAQENLHQELEKISASLHEDTSEDTSEDK